MTFGILPAPLAETTARKGGAPALSLVHACLFAGALVLAALISAPAMAQDWSFELGDGVWASGQTEEDGPLPGLEEPELDLSIGFARNDVTALTFDWRELDVDLENGASLIGDISRRVPIIGLNIKF